MRLKALYPRATNLWLFVDLAVFRFNAETQLPPERLARRDPKPRQRVGRSTAVPRYAVTLTYITDVAWPEYCCSWQDARLALSFATPAQSVVIADKFEADCANR